MEEFDLMSAVQPADGCIAIVGIKEGKTTQLFAETREEADKYITRLKRQEQNVFFGVARYKDDSSRTKANVLALKAFWIDIDCGDGKDYADQGEGLEALRVFCKTAGLPRPTLVNSGRGLHAYWSLTEAVTREQWEPVANRLKEVCLAQGLAADNACFEVARILRVPGTLNYKGDEPLPVEVVHVGNAVTYERFREILGVREIKLPAVFGQDRRKSALGEMIANDIQNSFGRIIEREDSCAQLLSCIEQREALSEPRWFNALSVAKFCIDRDEAIQQVSEGHPDYDPAVTEQKIQHIVGPHTCAQFENNNPGGCKGCPHKDKIRSPIVLGKVIEAADPEDNTVEDVDLAGQLVRYHVPEYPFPYVRGKNGGIYKQPDNAEAEPIFVYPYDLYVVKRMRDPNDGGVVLIRSHTPQDGIEEFTISNAKIAEPGEVRKELARMDILVPKKQHDMLVDYIIKSAQKLRHNKKAELMRNQFGWADGDQHFIIGDREISALGTFHSPPSSVTRAVTDHLVSNGSFEKWQEVFNLYGRKGLEAHAFAAATAFGAPLLRFSGQRGAILNLVHSASGTGKTTILHMCNSVWGDPAKLCAKKDDTFNSKVFKLGVFNNLPICFDEMTNTEPGQLSELAYLITQGTGKDRMRGSSNELRVNLTSWQTIALCSSNISFHDKLEALKTSPQGEIMRIMEINLDYSNAIDTEYGKQMFDHQLMENYGFAGEIYARYLVTERTKVKALYESIQQQLDVRLKLTQRERFWSALVAANITGIYIALHLKLCDWNVARIFKWACAWVNRLRITSTPPPATQGQTLGEFVLSRMDNILVVDDNVDLRTNLASLPKMEPKRELLIRIEPDTGKLFITSSAFKQFCAQRSIGYRETLNKMKEQGLYLKSGNKRMAKGMKVNLPGVQALEFDAHHSDFEGLTDLIDREDSVEATG